MATAIRAMSAYVRKATRVFSAQSQSARKGAIQQMASVLSPDSANVKQAGKEKTAQNVSKSQAVKMACVQSHMSAIVRRDLGGASVTNQTVAMDAMRQMDIATSRGSASARLGSKAGVVMSACLIPGV